MAQALAADKVRLPKGPPALAGAEKVAALLLAMDKRLASRLLKYFDEDDIKVIAQTAADLGAVAKPVVDSLIEEFGRQLKSGGDLMATADEVEQLLDGVVPPGQIAEIMAQVRTKSLQSIWARLVEIPDSNLAQYLTKEHPQIATLVLSRAATANAAAVLRLIGAEPRGDIVRRMLTMRPVLDMPLRLLEEAFSEDLLSNRGRKAGPSVHARLADIINKMDRKHMEEALQDLEAYQPKEAELVRNLLFTFEDIAKLSEAAMLALFDQVPPERIIIALQNAPPNLVQMVLATIPARSKRMMEQELASGKRALSKEVAKARRAIADLALELIERGVIELDGASEEE
jgi:flagellar motor switch protein FliG